MASRNRCAPRPSRPGRRHLRRGHQLPAHRGGPRRGCQHGLFGQDRPGSRARGRPAVVAGHVERRQVLGEPRARGARGGRRAAFGQPDTPAPPRSGMRSCPSRSGANDRYAGVYVRLSNDTETTFLKLAGRDKLTRKVTAVWTIHPYSTGSVYRPADVGNRSLEATFEDGTVTGRKGDGGPARRRPGRAARRRARRGGGQRKPRQRGKRRLRRPAAVPEKEPSYMNDNRDEIQRLRAMRAEAINRGDFGRADAIGADLARLESRRGRYHRPHHGHARGIGKRPVRTAGAPFPQRRDERPAQGRPAYEDQHGPAPRQSAPTPQPASPSAPQEPLHPAARRATPAAWRPTFASRRIHTATSPRRRAHTAPNQAARPTPAMTAVRNRGRCRGARR